MASPPEGWRLTRHAFADLSGTGAREYGGRWNSRGRPVVYLAEHPALAVLEVRVHLDLPFDLLPEDYVLLRVGLPDGIAAALVDELPSDPIAAGDEWLSGGATAMMRVPSVLVPRAHNLLLNPLHRDSAGARALEVIPFAFDERLWAVGA
jgi:RES domain-containing protein